MKRIIYSLVGLVMMLSFLMPAYGQVEDILKEGTRQYYRGNYQEAVKLLKQYVQSRPDPQAYYMIGYGLYELGRYDEAAKYFKEAYLIDPNFTPEYRRK